MHSRKTIKPSVYRLFSPPFPLHNIKLKVLQEHVKTWKMHETAQSSSINTRLCAEKRHMHVVFCFLCMCVSDLFIQHRLSYWTEQTGKHGLRAGSIWNKSKQRFKATQKVRSINTSRKRGWVIGVSSQRCSRLSHSSSRACEEWCAAEQLVRAPVLQGHFLACLKCFPA